MRLIFLALSLLLLPAAKTMDDVRALLAQDRAEDAFNLASRAAGAGDHDGDEALGWFYDSGTWVEQDKARAVGFFERAAKAGWKHSQWRLGVMLDAGEGVAADPAAGVRWMMKSAAQNYARAYVSLGVMHALGRGTPVDYALSMQSYRHGASLGEAHGFYGVGMLHHFGQGVPQNEVEALAWLIVADSQGDGQAAAGIELLMQGLGKADIGRAAQRAAAIGKEFGLQVVATEPVS